MLTGLSLRSHGVSADGGVDSLVKILVGLGLVVIEALGPESESSLGILKMNFTFNFDGDSLRQLFIRFPSKHHR